MRRSRSGIDRTIPNGYYRSMIETGSLVFGLGFSVIVYFLSIRKADLPPLKKAWYFLISFIGITGMVFLSGILIAHSLRKHGWL